MRGRGPSLRGNRNRGDWTSCGVAALLSATSPSSAHLNTYLPTASASRFELPPMTDNTHQRFHQYGTCLLPKKRLRVDTVQSSSDRRENDPVALMFMQQCGPHAGVKNSRDDERSYAQVAAETPAPILSTAIQRCEVLQCMGDRDGGGMASERRLCSTSLGDLSGTPSLYEAVLSAFPFVLPINEMSPVHTSNLVFTAGTHVAPTGGSQPYPILMEAAKNISEMATHLALEIAELRRNGERLAQLLPEGIFPSEVGTGGRLSRTRRDKCRKGCGAENALTRCIDVSSPPTTSDLWCDCVASVTVSIESSMLSVLYEKEAVQLFHQDILDTKYQWWRAVKMHFARKVQLETEDAVPSTEARQACYRSPGELRTHDTERETLLSELAIAYEATKHQPTLQRWASCCFCSPISLAYLAKAQEQLYYLPDGFTGLSSRTSSWCGGTSSEYCETRGTLANNIALRANTEVGENDRRNDSGGRKLGLLSTLDIFHGSPAGLQERRPTAVHKEKNSVSPKRRHPCGLHGDSDKRRRIWQWLWEAAGALGFCASSRFLAMQLLDAYLQQGRCNVDTSERVQVATAAVAAVLLAAASRCHWRNVRDDAFLLALLRQLELPSTVDDVIQTQADMLRLLPSFLFTRRSPVDYLACFLSNLRWLPQVLEHSSSMELAWNENPGCRSTPKRSTSKEAYATQEGLFKQRPALEERLFTISFGLQSEEEWSPEGGLEASKHIGDVRRSRAPPGKKYFPEIERIGARAGDAFTSKARGISPAAMTCTAAPTGMSAERPVSLFDYWRCTGLLGCLEGLVLRCCSAFVASGTLCARVPISRMLAVLLLEVFEPYSWHRLQCQKDTVSDASSGRSAETSNVGPCNEPKEAGGRVNSSVSSSGRNWSTESLRWYRYISVSVFRMHFDADLLFWKLLLQPLTKQLLHLPENRSFLLLWKRGVKEWTMLLRRCSRATCVKGAYPADTENTIPSHRQSKELRRQTRTPSVGQEVLRKKHGEATASRVPVQHSPNAEGASGISRVSKYQDMAVRVETRCRFDSLSERCASS